MSLSFSEASRTFKATVVSVYDGDTITVAVETPFDCTFKITLRLSDIDTPEVRGEERPEGLVVRDRVREWLPNGSVCYIQINEKRAKGKYGRYLAKVYYGENKICLNDQLLQEDMAVPYPG